MKNNKKLLLLIFILSFCTLIYSLYNIIIWKLDSNSTKKELEIIDNLINSQNLIIDNSENNLENEKEDNKKDNPYWDYTKMNLINVNFQELREVNNDIVGWIQVKGTNVNYPYVQAKDNKFYLTHSLDKSYNKAGWIFLDYRNYGTSDKNTIIYGHNRLDKTMFGSLRDTLKTTWFQNKANHIIKISNEYENTLWQIFSIYTIPNTNDYMQINFNDEKEYLEFINLISERSIHQFNTNVSETDKILTLSTCYKNSSNKLVIHAKLIKIEKR